MEVNSTILNYKSFKFVKESLEKVSEIDHEEKFRVNSLEYIEDSTDNDDDEFFFDMMANIRYLDPSSDAIAYTDQYCRIFLNCPGSNVGKDLRMWEFVFEHECLHQLWETFEVAEEIKKSNVEYNHQLLNIASDCVINDYLKRIRKKKPFPDGIFPETLEDKYGIIYNPKKDTQYSLYMKLLEKKEQIMNDPDMQNMMDKYDSGEQGQSGDSSNSGGQGSQGSKQSQRNSSGSGNTNDSGDSEDSNGSDSANSKDKNDNNSKNGNSPNNGDGYKNGESNGEGDKDKNDKEGQGNNKNQGDEGNDSSNGKSGDDSKDKSKSSNGTANGKSPGTGAGHGTGTWQTSETLEDLENIRKESIERRKRYSQRIAGAIGEFISKCNASKSMENKGIEAKVRKGSGSWNLKMNKYLDGWVNMQVFEKKREWKQTYSRVKRGTGFVKFGDPIQPGKKRKKEKLTIDCAFYVDNSTSMSTRIDSVSKALYTICESLKQDYSHEAVVDDVLFTIFEWNDKFYPIKYGTKLDVYGGTMSFENLLDGIVQRTKDYMCNVIITDGEFPDVNINDIKKFTKELSGMILYISNNDNEAVKKIFANDKQGKLQYILASSDFEL